MATTLETLRSEMRNITGTFPFFTGENEVGDNAVDQAIAQAITIYSRDFPRIVVESEIGDSGKYYPFGEDQKLDGSLANRGGGNNSGFPGGAGAGGGRGDQADGRAQPERRGEAGGLGLDLPRDRRDACDQRDGLYYEDWLMTATPPRVI